MADPDDPSELARALVADGKPQQAILLLTLADMERQITAAGWDQHPWLFLLHRDMPPTAVADTLAGLGSTAQVMRAQSLGTVPVENTDQLVRVLAGLARSVAGQESVEFSPALGDDMVAWVLTLEAWMAKAENDPEAQAKLEMDATMHRIHERPDRVEVRLVLAVDRAGIRYQVVRRRDDATEAYVDETGGDPMEAGRIIGHLAALMEATP